MYTHIREEIARSILLGFEIIIIRTLLSVSLEWKSRKNSHGKNKIPKREFFSAKFRQHAQKHLSYQ